jgi:hypothetical protein
MQPEPTELPEESPNSLNPSDLVNTSQYGLLTDHLPAAGLRKSPLEGNPTPGGSSAARSLSDAALPGNLSRLSSDDNHGSRPKPSFQRISEYENALSPSPPKRRNNGPGFTVIKKPGNALHGPQLENFPNGNNPYFSPSRMF